MKLYFLSGISLTVAYVIQILNKDFNTRVKIIVPVLILFFITFYSFILEYENQRRNAWGKKEKKLVENVYSKFIEMYFHKREVMEKSKIDQEKERLIATSLKDNFLLNVASE